MTNHGENRIWNKRFAILVALILLVSSFSSIVAPQKAAAVTPDGWGWRMVGNSDFSGGGAGKTSFDMYDGIPYIAYYDFKSTSGITVMKYDGNNWVMVGSPRFSGPDAYGFSLFIDKSDGTPYVSYTDGSAGVDNKATVMKFNGTNWEPVGSVGFSPGAAGRISLFVDHGTPYVAFEDSSTGPGKVITVMKYNASTWSLVGTPRFATGASSFIDNISLSVYNNTPFISYWKDAYEIKVMTYDSIGGWVPVGGAVSSDYAARPSLYLDNGTLYVAYMDDPAHQNRATVKKFNLELDSMWSTVGSRGFSAGTVDDLSLYVDGGIPYVVYQDGSVSDDYKATVMKYKYTDDPDDTDWENVGRTHFSPSWAAFMSLRISGGIPYVGFQDVRNHQFSSQTDNYAVVMKMTDVAPPTVESVTYGTTSAITSSGLSETGITLHWDKAWDNATPQNLLKYQVYRSDSGNIDTVTDIVYNGTPIGSETADIGSINVSGLSRDTTYYFNVIVKDPVGNKSGYTMKTITTAQDTTAPTITDRTPVNNATGVPVNANLTLTFSESVEASNGKYMTIKKVSDDSVVETIAATDSSKLSVTGLTYTVNPAANLAYSTQYYVTADVGAFQDAAGNLYAGIADPGAWRFTTEAAASTPPSSPPSNPTGDVPGPATSPPSSPPSNPTGNVPGPATSPQADQPKEINIVVGGKEQQIATASVTTEAGKTVMKVTMDSAKLTEQLAGLGDNHNVVIPLTQSADKVSVALTGDAVKALEGKQAVMEIQTPNGNYKLPGAEISIDALSAQFGVQVNPADITIHVEIVKSDADKVTLMQNSADKGGYTLVVPPVDFSVTASYNGQTISVDKFSHYVEREIPLPDGVDPTRITTAVVLEADGSIRQVPTMVKERNGKYYAVVNSLTNSTYSLISHQVAFEDMDGHWAKKAVNDMASRMVVSGVDGVHFNPNEAITRAEFAAILVRAVGLSANGSTDAFSDVKADDWYAGAAAKAKEYGLISGYEDSTFRPANPITRQEAMVMIARAMKIVGLETDMNSADIEKALEAFSDGAAIGNWAKPAFIAVVKSGIVQGSGKGLLPKYNITRAETAAIVERLLQKANLID